MMPQEYPAEAQRSESTTYLTRVVTTPRLRNEFASFIDIVLRQASSQDFYNLVGKLQAAQPLSHDLELYERLLAHTSAIQPRFSTIQKLKALYHQKTELSAQIKALIGSNKSFNNIVEIGTPGMYASCIKKTNTITGTTYVIHEKESYADRIQGFSYNPFKGFAIYDHFIPLNAYEPITKDAIPSNSVDLVVCFIGLHHIPQEKLPGFVASIARILRPGGIFILRDHDITNDDLMAITHSAHTVFNALMTQETVEAENNEYRNFQSLQYWIDLLHQHGLIAGEERILQNGDPTRNTLLKFVKESRNVEERTIELSDKLKKQSSYFRDSVQGDLSSPEWINVDAAQEYGSFINHTPFYEFPYMASVAAYWKVFGHSWHLATQKQGALKTLFSPYTLMNLFIGTTMTIEYAAKSIISLPLRLAYSGAEDLTITMIMRDPAHKLEKLDAHITVLSSDDIFTVIRMPRYKEFVRIVQKIAQDPSIQFVEIAGQREINVKVRFSAHQPFDTIINTLSGCKQQYTWRLPTQPAYTYAVITIPLNQLSTAIKQLPAHGAEILYIHDF